MPKGEFTIFDDPVVNVIKSKIPAAAAEINTDNKKNICPPHDHKHSLGEFSMADKKNIEDAIDLSLIHI